MNHHRQTPALRRELRAAAASKSAWRLFGTSILCLLAACGGHKTSSDEPEPIPECLQYQEALSVCTGQNLPISHETQVMPESERAQARKLCAVNLRRIKTACR